MANDPRAENCRAFRQDDAGKIVGVEVAIRMQPGTRFELVHVQLLDEYQAQGQTVATVHVRNRNNVPLADPVALAWPWPGLQHGALPGSSKIPAEHVIVNKYWPPDRGPLAVHVGQPGAPESDIVGGLGLPLGHHVSYSVVFRERNGDGNGNGNGNDNGGGNGNGALLSRVERLERIVAAMVKEAS